MLLIVLRIVYAVVCAGAIVAFIYPGQEAEDVPGFVREHPYLAAVLLMLLTQSVTILDVVIRRKRIEVISAVYFGLLIGVLLSYVLGQALALAIPQDSPLVSVLILLISLVLPYICISTLLQTKDDFRFVIPYVEFAKELKHKSPLVVDSSALIDGRIGDLADTNIIDSQLVVPDFILREVQDIADSNDKLRRSRGRRGLEVLGKLQNNPKIEIRIHETDGPDRPDLSVDQRLIEICKELDGRVVTNDFNLNKVAGVQGIPVVNLNDVANALKPRYLPGERLKIKVIKEGESPGQGVGYLDDGTMVVCEQTSHLIGRDVDVIVTSVLQSSAGRMIFGRQVHQAGAS